MKMNLFVRKPERFLFEVVDKLEKENAELKQKLYSSDKNVFAELNEETAKSNAYLMDKVEYLEKENAKFSKMLEMAINEVLLCGKQMKADHPSMIVWTEETFRAELEKRVEEHKNDNNCPDVMCDDCNKECELKKIMGETK